MRYATQTASGSVSEIATRAFFVLPPAAGAFWLWNSLRKREEAEFNVPEAVVIPDPAHIAIDEVTDQTLVTIQLGYGLIHLTDEKHGATLIARLTGLRKQMCQTFGFIVPQFRIEDSDPWRGTWSEDAFLFACLMINKDRDLCGLCA